MKNSEKRSFFKLEKLFFVFLLLVGMGLFIPQTVNAQVCDPAAAPGDPGSCGSFGFPRCYECVGGTACVASDAFCEDGNPCTENTCNPSFTSPSFPDSFINGCESNPLFNEDNTLPIECYICEPTANNVLVDNGICDRAAGENCNNSTDCQTPLETCIFPNSPTITDQLCDTGVVQGNIYPLVECADGDSCTLDLCDANIAPTCVNPERACDPSPDGCCPVDCFGPSLGDDCLDAAGAPIPGCDIDCWPPQSCGDGVVQPPETCDDSADLSNAGINPNTGQAVSNADCRDSGATAECTYCGDNIIQTAAGEQCDGTSLGVCDQLGCDTTTCLCIVPITDLQVQGSGPPWGPCSLNPHATDDPKKGMLGILSLGLALGLLLGWRRRFG